MTNAKQKESNENNTFLIGLLLTTLVVGILVIAFNSEYRIDYNLASNEDYYPNVEVSDMSNGGE